MDLLRSFNALCSSRTTTIIRGLRSLSSLLDSSEPLDELISAEEETKICLNEIFQQLQKVLVKEAHRAHTKERRGTAPSTRAQRMNSELKKAFCRVMGRAGEKHHRISAENLLTSVNQIFGSVYLRTTFGYYYYKYVIDLILRKRSYWGEITGKGWRDLIRISKIAYQEGVIGLEKERIAKSIAQIVTLGSMHSNLSLWIAGDYRFLLDVVINTNHEVTHDAESSMMLALSFATKVAKENRELACKFGEEVLGLALQCYDPTASEIFILKSLVLEFLIFQVKVHHPDGAIMGSMGAYAYDPQTWEGALRNMYEMVQQELLETIIPSSFSKEAYGRFLEFAVAVTYQIMNIAQPSFTGQEDATSVSDTTKPIETGFQVVLNVLTELPENSAWLWLQIISLLIKQYKCIDGYNYDHFLEYLSSCDITSRGGVTLDSFFRAIGLNQCESSAHEVICAIIARNLASKKQIGDLFKMYVNDQVRPSCGSIRTLQNLFMSFSIVDDMEFMTRRTCFNWIYPVTEKLKYSQNVLPAELIADVLVQLCLKAGIKKLPTKRIESRCGPLEDFYLKLTFCNGLLIPCTNPSREAGFKSPDDLSLDEASFNVLTDMVSKGSEGLLSWVNSLLISGVVPEEGVAAADFLSTQLQVVVLVASKLIEWGLLTHDTAEMKSFLNLFKRLMESLADLLEVILGYPQSAHQLVKTFSNLAFLYEFQVDEHFATFMRGNTPGKLINMLMCEVKARAGALKTVSPSYMRSTTDKYVLGTTINYTDFYSILNPDIYPESTSLIMLGCKVLGGYSCRYGGNPCLPKQREAIKNFLEFIARETNDIGFPVIFQMLMEYLCVLFNKMEISVPHLTIAFSMFESIISAYSGDMELLQIFISVLEEVCIKALTYSLIQDTVMKSSEFYLKRLYSELMKRILPPSITVKVVKLLGGLIKINPEMTWPWLLDNDDKQICIRNFMCMQLDSPFIEVRMAVAANVFFILEPQRYTCVAEDSSCLNMMMKYIANSCSEESSIPAEDIRERNNVVVALHCLAVVSVATPKLRKEAVYYMLKLFTIHRLNHGFGKMIIHILGEKLKCSGRELLCSYLFDYLEKWINSNEFKEFPYWLIYNCVEDFYLENAGVIFSILWMVNHESLDEFCFFFGKKAPEMLEDHSALVISLTLCSYLNLGEESVSVMDTEMNKLNKVIKVLPGQNLYEALSKKENSILYNIFRLFHDENITSTVAEQIILSACAHKIYYPRRGRLFYTKEMLYGSCDYLTYLCEESKGVMFIDYLIKENPWHLRSVLLMLANDVINAPTACDALTALVSYKTYIHFIMGYITEITGTQKENIVLRKLCTGLIRDSSFSYLRLLRRWCRSDNDTIYTLGFIYFRQDLMDYFAPLMEGRQVLLVPLIYGLVDMVKDECLKPFEHEALALMQYLLEMEPLQGDIAYLVKFPRTPMFHNLNEVMKKAAGGGDTSLKNDLDSFLKANSLLGVTWVETVHHLKLSLRDKKMELNDLYLKIERESDSFWRYGENVLHKTICLLSKLCTTSDHEIKTEAGKCLAELGAGDIKVAVLVHETAVSNSRCSSNVVKNPLNKLTCKCFELIPKYLLDPSIEVVEATSAALIAIINSQEGMATLRDEWFSQLKLAEDYTIVCKPPAASSSLAPLEFSKAAFSATHGLWIPNDDRCHSKWIMALVSALLRCFPSMEGYLRELIPICSLKVQLCEELFPFLAELFLLCGDVSSHVALFEQLHHFFQIFYEMCSSKSGHIPIQRADGCRNKRSVITMLNAINYINAQHYKTQMKFSDGEDDAIDHLHCAVAAYSCSAYFSAIQYCELWLSHVSKGNEVNNLSHHVRVDTPHVTEIVQVLRESYAGLGDADGQYGCGTMHLLEPLGRIEYFMSLDKWEQVLRSYELELNESCKRKAMNGLLMSLEKQGMDELLMGLLEARCQEDMAPFKYDCAWRLSSWELLSQFSEKEKHSSELLFIEYEPKTETIYQICEEKYDIGYERNFFQALRFIHKGKYTDSLCQVDEARNHVINELASMSLEPTQNMYRPISRLQALQEIEEFCTLSRSSKERSLKTIVDQWEHSDIIGKKDFRTVEPINALRSILLKHCQRRATSLNITDEYTKAMAKIQLCMGHSAREAGLYSLSEKYLRAVRAVPRLLEDPLMACQLASEEAQLFWAKGEADVAKIIMQRVVNAETPIKDKRSAQCHAEALTVYGHWVMKTHAGKAKETIFKCFKQATDVMDSFELNKSSQIYLNAVRAMAVYADEQYVSLKKYVESASYAKKKQHATHSMNIVTNYEGSSDIRNDEKQSPRLLAKQAKDDEKELEECGSNKASFLNVALSHYIKYLQYSQKEDLEIIFRFISLFLENDFEVVSIFNEIENIPAYKFIPVIPQLLPRIVISKGRNSRTLKRIVEKCACQHPHHVLPSILALGFSLKDLDKAQGSDAFITETQKANQKAAQRMITKLRRREDMRKYVHQLSILWEALISLAYLPADRTRSANVMGPRVLLNKVRDLSYVHVPTAELPITTTGKYNIVSVWKYLPEFVLVGGINVPKKITCIGSDGRRYSQLLKGQDDLRQDAVMQQVFNLMNSLLLQDEECRKRRLRMRTYKVVPLSHRSGLIEWCNTTRAIGNYLLGYKNVVGAHSKYNPADLPARLCWKMLEDVIGSSKKIKLQVFKDICERFQPVFRHYFFTKYPNPGVWYQMRQAYTRSVATSSIIGYVLGLGDRHLNNILIDENTAEVLHVDLGVSFEQGKTLNQPETIPFRLTRDIVDGMGISGVEGVFRRSCEVTMSLMRKNSKVILTVLEVLIYDPLYAWTLKPKYKTLEDTGRQTEAVPDSSQTWSSSPLDEGQDPIWSLSSTSSSSPTPTPTPAPTPAPTPTPMPPPSKLDTSKGDEKASTFPTVNTSLTTTEASTQSAERSNLAMRALERLEQKLMGTEDGIHPSSIKAQVEKLIKEAQDPENLCVLYPGWQPYL